MKPKHQRLIFVLVSVIFVMAASLLTLRAFRENLVFFYSPSDIAAHPPALNTLIRIGGLIEDIQHGEDNKVVFVVTDGQAKLTIEYHGILPALFREGQGVVAEGHLSSPDHLTATRVLTKHDENYMPKEVVDALKKSGRWQEKP